MSGIELIGKKKQLLHRFKSPAEKILELGDPWKYLVKKCELLYTTPKFN